MVLHPLEKHFEADAIVQVLARVDLVTEVDTGRVKGIEDRPPAFRQFVEGRLDQSGRALRPGVDVGPGERAGKGDMRAEAEVTGSLCGTEQLVDGPFLARTRIAAHLGRREAVKGLVVSRMHRHQLALQMRRQLGDFDAVAGRHARDLVAVGLGLRCLFQVEQPAVPTGNLHTLVAEIGRPGANRFERIERRLVARELSQKYRRPLHRFHLSLLSIPGVPYFDAPYICTPVRWHTRPRLKVAVDQVLQILLRTRIGFRLQVVAFNTGGDLGQTALALENRHRLRRPPTGVTRG